MNTTLFAFNQYWWLYATFTIFVLLLIWADLKFFHCKSKTISNKEAIFLSLFWIGLSFVFNAGLYYFSLDTFGEAQAKKLSLEFLTGFIIEKSLAVDNIFLFYIVFSSFKIPMQYQHRVLFYGILGALVMRAFFIFVGNTLMQYQFIVIGFF